MITLAESLLNEIEELLSPLVSFSVIGSVAGFIVSSLTVAVTGSKTYFYFFSDVVAFTS